MTRTQKPPPAHKPATVARTITIGETKLNLKFDFSALARLEELYDCNAKELSAKLSKVDPVTGKLVADIRIGDMVKMIWAGAVKQHPDLTQDAVMDIMDAALDAAVGDRGTAMGQILSDTFDAFNAGQDGPAKANPPQAAKRKAKAAS